MLFYFALFIFILACLFNLWLITCFIKSKGQNPPFIISFGRPKEEMIRQAASFLQQHPNAKTVDLGCGLANLLLPLAKQFPNHQFVGYEWSFFLHKWAVFRTRNLPNLKILRHDFFKTDLHDYQLVLCYYSSTFDPKLGTKLNTELPQNSLVISEFFKLPILKLKQQIPLRCCFIKTKIYLYTPND